MGKISTSFFLWEFQDSRICDTVTLRMVVVVMVLMMMMKYHCKNGWIAANNEGEGAETSNSGK